MNYSLSALRKHGLIVLFFICLSLALFAPFGSNEYIPNAFSEDFRNHTAIVVQARDAINEGQFPIRISPYQHTGLRYPLFQFYSPLFFTIGGSFYKWITPNNPLAALKLTLLLGLFLGGFFAYLCVLKITRSTSIALLSAAAYLCAPYVIITLNYRAALPENFAMGLLPLILYLLISIFYEAKKLPYALLFSLSVSALCLTHSITFFYSSGFIFIFSLIYCMRSKDYLSLKMITLGYFLAFLLCLWFIAGVWLISPLLYVHNQLWSPFITQEWTQLAALFSTTKISPAPYPAPYFNLPPKPHYSTPIYVSLGLPIIIALITPFIYYKNEHRTVAKRLIFGLSLTFIMLMLFLWAPFDIYSLLPDIFLMAQYTYRLLSQSMWIGFILFAFMLWHWYPNGIIPSSLVILFLGIIISCCSPWFVTQTDKHYLADVISKPHMGYAFPAYLLNWEKVHTYELFNKEEGSLSKNCELKGHTMLCHVTPPAEASTFRLPMLYYPGMLDVRVNGVKSEYLATFSSEGQIMTFVPTDPTSRTVEATFVGYTWANWISGLTFCGIIGMLGWLWVRKR